MPNWCNNVLTADVNLKEKLNQFVVDGELDFNKIFPCPEELYKTNAWYDWCVTNWGTKWSPYGTSFSGDGKSVSFSTAWGPPLPIIKLLSDILKEDLRLIYSERGMGFHGEYQVFKDGFVADDCFTYDDLPEELKEEITETFNLYDVTSNTE